MANLLQTKPYFWEPLITFSFWVIFLGAPFMFTNAENGFGLQDALMISLPNIPLFIAFLINRFIFLPKLYFNQKRREYVFAVVGLIVVLAIGKTLIPLGSHQPADFGPPLHHINADSPPHVPGSPPRHEASDSPFSGRRNAPFPRMLVFTFLSIMIIGVDTGIKSAIKLSRKEREHNQLEKENVTNQLAFLRNQVSPHFFMNTLNNIHALVDIDVSEAKEAIIKLSKLMRHLLYDSEADRLPLKKEIDFIRSYVELMKLRYSSKVDIVLKTPDHIPQRDIPPLLFTSILENAFKYGISYQKPSFINISLRSKADALIFEVSNSNHQPSKKAEYSGIGLKNTRQRLDLLYQDQYVLEVLEKNNVYTVYLSLPL